MPPHLIQRGPKKIYYLVDGRTVRSLATTVKRYALLQLEKYSRGKLQLDDELTVKEFYDRWIVNMQNNSTLRPSAVRDYVYAFKYVLPEFGDLPLSQLDAGKLAVFRNKLLRTLSQKSCRNIIDGSFRAMWRAASYENLVDRNPFTFLQWAPQVRTEPDPFTSVERDTIIAHFLLRDPFYYPWAFVQFHTGMRPSEASALTWNDVDLEAGTIAIRKSRDMGKTSATKTTGSHRIIPISEAVKLVLLLLPSRDLGLSHVFVNKFGRALSKKWAEHNWSKTLKKLGIRHRKFYATRHTFITEAIKAGDSPVAVAQYCGTSVEMIMKDYCGTVRLLSIDAAKIQHVLEKPFINMVAGPGFESGKLLPGIAQLRRKQRNSKDTREMNSEKNRALRSIASSKIRQERE